MYAASCVLSTIIGLIFDFSLAFLRNVTIFLYTESL